jgi:hypothetical protein
MFSGLRCTRDSDSYTLRQIPAAGIIVGYFRPITSLCRNKAPELELASSRMMLALIATTIVAVPRA